VGDGCSCVETGMRRFRVVLVVLLLLAVRVTAAGYRYSGLLLVLRGDVYI
jgi:hypothetical protein